MITDCFDEGRRSSTIVQGDPVANFSQITFDTGGVAKLSH